MRRKKIKWQPDDVFLIPLLNKKYVVGHVLDQRMVNAVRIALYDEVIEDLNNIDLTQKTNLLNLISLIEVTREQLDYGVWIIAGNKKSNVPIDRFPNEEFRKNRWINSIVHDAALVEDFVNSFYSLLLWKDWYAPNYLDSYLISMDKKPKNLLYK